MTSTALRAENSNSCTITFKSKEHEKFYMEYLEKCRYQDVYHQALVYCLGIDRDTRNNVDKIYNFKTGCVKTECLQERLQITSCGLMLDPELYLSVIPVLQDDSRYHVAVFQKRHCHMNVLLSELFLYQQ